MSPKPKDGGAAFPRRPWERRNEDGILLEADYGSDGMSLRDYLAAAALTGIYQTADRDAAYDDIAKDAYAVADAMLSARGGQTQ